MNYKYIYLVFSSTGTILSRIIRFFTTTQYVHTSISFDCGFKKMYSFGRKNPNNPFSGGLVEENFCEGVYKKFPSSECLIYKVKVTEEQYNCIKQTTEIFITQKNKYKYNFLGLFGVLLNKPIKRQYHYFCSQFISELLIISNVYISQKPPELIKADDLFLIKNKEFFYKGFIKEYNIQLENAV